MKERLIAPSEYLRETGFSKAEDEAEGRTK